MFILNRSIYMHICKFVLFASAPGATESVKASKATSIIETLRRGVVDDCPIKATKGVRGSSLRSPVLTEEPMPDFAVFL